MSAKNISSENVELIGFGQSCDCFEINPKLASIPPGESITLSLDFDLRQDMHTGSRSFQYQIVPYIKGQSRPADAWAVRGEFVDFLDYSPAVVRFTDSIEPEGKMPFVEVGISTSVPLKALNVEECDDLAKFSVSRHSDSLYTLHIQIVKGIPRSRDLRTMVTLRAQLEDGSIVRSRGPLLLVRIPGDFVVSPAQVHLGILDVGSEFKHSFLVRALASSKCSVKAIKGEENGVEIPVKWKLAGTQISSESTLVEILHQVSIEGDCHLNLELELEGSDGDSTVLEVPVKYIGVQRDGKNDE